MIATRELYESFWKAGIVPITRTMRIGAIDPKSNKAEVKVKGFEIPGDILESWTLDELQAAVDAAPQFGPEPYRFK